jgi:hypothetical protein
MQEHRQLTDDPAVETDQCTVKALDPATFAGFFAAGFDAGFALVSSGRGELIVTASKGRPAPSILRAIVTTDSRAASADRNVPGDATTMPSGQPFRTHGGT